jgi:hypothetical protein
MAGYRCYILDADGHIVQAHDIECESDMHAGESAGHILIQDPYHKAAEVWKTSRLVIKLEQCAALHLPGWERELPPGATIRR